MKEKLFEILQTFGAPIYLQGTLAENADYPGEFITYITTDSETAAAYDNDEAATAWAFQIAYYSNDPAKVDSAQKKIRATLKAAGFIPQGRGYDLPSDRADFTGWVCDYYYLENEGVL